MAKHRTVSFGRQISNYFFVVRRVWQYSKSLVLVYGVKALVDGLNPVVQAFLVGGLINELTLIPGGQASQKKAIILLVLSVLLQLLFTIVSALERYKFVVNRETLEMEMNQSLMKDRVETNIAHIELPETKDKYDRALMGASEALWDVRYTTDLLSAVIGIIGVIGALVVTVPWALIVLLPLPLINTRLSIDNLIKNRIYWDERRSHRVRISSISRMFTSEKGILEIRMFNIAQRILSMWRKEYGKAVDISRNKELLAAKQELAINSLETGVGVAVDIWLVTRVFAGAMTLGLFEQSRRLVGTYVLSLNRLSSSASNIIIYGYHIDDYRNFVEEAQEYEAQRVGTKKLESSVERIVFSDVSFSYPTKEEKVLDGVSLEINRGESIAIVGANGAGKTTLIKNLFGFYDPIEGLIQYDGISHRDVDFVSLYKHSSSLMQDFSTFDFLTIGQSVALSFGDQYDRKKVKKALKTVGLSEVIDGLPKGLDTNYGYVEDDGFKLSGGQAQRLAIARILYRRAPILVLDEPTSAIDAKSEQEIMDHILDLYNNKTLVVISHRLSTVSRADKIVFMKDGKVAEIGTHKELFKKGTGYYDLFHKQSLRIK